MHTFKEMHELIESMAVHAHPLGGGKFKVHKVGSAVKHVKVGDEVTSSDLDDLADAGHKVKETKGPKVVKEESDAHEKAEMKTLKRLEKKTDKLIDKDKAVHKKLGEETLDESSHYSAGALHKTLLKGGMEHSFDDDGETGQTDKVVGYEPTKNFKHGSEKALLKKHGFKYSGADKEGHATAHYFDHKDGHGAMVYTSNKTGKVKEIHIHHASKD